MKATALTSVLLAAGLTAGCVKKSTHQRALDRIGVLEGDLSERDRQIAERDGKLGTLGGELDATKAERDRQIAERDAQLSLAEGEKAATRTELEELRRSRDAAEKRAAAYRELQSKFAALVDTGALKVAFRNGQMVLQLPSGVLFASGRADLTAAGQAALADITGVLAQFKDRRFMIAGHTDNVPIKSRTFKNNWFLSTARAISVLEFMVGAGFTAKNLAATGYGAEDPVQPNDTEAGKEQNRRIEIILVPNLEELPSLTGSAE